MTDVLRSKRSQGSTDKASKSHAKCWFTLTVVTDWFCSRILRRIWRNQLKSRTEMESAQLSVNRSMAANVIFLDWIQLHHCCQRLKADGRRYKECLIAMIFEETNICFQSYPVYIDHLVFYRLCFSRAIGGVIELCASTFRRQEHLIVCLSECNV